MKKLHWNENFLNSIERNSAYAERISSGIVLFDSGRNEQLQELRKLYQFKFTTVIYLSQIFLTALREMKSRFILKRMLNTIIHPCGLIEFHHNEVLLLLDHI